jgi:hypothetical protein
VTSITSPANCALVSVRSNLTLSASASDNVGVSRVEFYVNGTLNCTDTATPYSCSWRVPAKAGRTYRLQTRALDPPVNVRNSATVTEISR